MFLKRLATAALFAASLYGQLPTAKLALPEKTRLLQGQLVDLVIEVRNANAVSGLRVYAGNEDITANFGAATKAALDCDASSDWVYRANLQSFNGQGVGYVDLQVQLLADNIAVQDSRRVEVRPFQQPRGRNLILFIGDAMGTAYRDTARLVDRATLDANGKSAFREGLFDSLAEMDKMPVSGMSMTYGTDAVVPDSANSGTAWATGNKTFNGAVNVFADGTDCKWLPSGQQTAANLPQMLDNPRVENLWQYLKRTQGYRAGIVSTAAITDATPAVEGGYTAYRQTRQEIAKQYRANPMLGGAPAFDVILGGGADPFIASGRGDGRDLVGEFKSLGFRYVTNAAQLTAITGPQPVLGLFKSGSTPAPNSAGLATVTDANMDVAYDKLGLQRPASEPTAALDAFSNQPMLDLMTAKAIEVLSTGGAPFILMVEAASIDKQSHPNQAAGVIWDVIEMDRAVGVARTWAAARRSKDTLILVTADHDQSMVINGTSVTPDAEYFNRSTKFDVTMNSPVGAQGFTVFGDSFTNVRSAYPYLNSGGAPATISTGPSPNGNGGPPGAFNSLGTQATYSRLTAYKKGANGYPVNEGAGTVRLAVGFRTGDHTGSSVPITAEGPGALLFTGYMDQSDIFFKMAASASMDTKKLDDTLEYLKTAGFPTTPGK